MEENTQVHSATQMLARSSNGIVANRAVQLFIFRQFHFRNEPAILSWSIASSSVQLTRQASDISPATTIFNVPFQQIEKADFSFGRVYLKIAGKKYGLVMHERNLLFASKIRVLIQVADDIALADRAGLDDLRQILLANGVAAGRARIARSVLIGAVIGVVVLTILITLAYTVIPQNPQ